MSDNESTWIEFEAWMDDVSICGFMNLDDADDEAPLQFYGYDGLECGSHIRNTRCGSFTDAQEMDWAKLCDWFRTTDVVQYLVDFAEESKQLLFAVEDDWGRVGKVEFYINCSKLDGE